MNFDQVIKSFESVPVDENAISLMVPEVCLLEHFLVLACICYFYLFFCITSKPYLELVSTGIFSALFWAILYVAY